MASVRYSKQFTRKVSGSYIGEREAKVDYYYQQLKVQVSRAFFVVFLNGKVN